MGLWPRQAKKTYQNVLIAHKQIETIRHWLEAWRARLLSSHKAWRDISNKIRASFLIQSDHQQEVRGIRTPWEVWRP